MTLFSKGDVVRDVTTPAEETKARWEGFKPVEQSKEDVGTRVTDGEPAATSTAPGGELADRALAEGAEVSDPEVKAALEKRQANLTAKTQAKPAKPTQS